MSCGVAVVLALGLPGGEARALLPEASPMPAAELHKRPTCEDGFCFPTLYILGAQKAATTSLFVRVVEQGVACSAELNGTLLESCTECSGKETHFFVGPRKSTGEELAIQGRGWLQPKPHSFKRDDYTQMYPESKMKKVGCDHFVDGTPALQHSFSADRMWRFIPQNLQPQVRLLVVLREPVSRDLSWYNHQVDVFEDKSNHLVTLHTPPPKYDVYVATAKKNYAPCLKAAGGNAVKAGAGCNGPEGDPLSTLVWGMYAAQLERVLARWHRSQVMVLQMEAMLDDTWNYMHRIYGFIGTTKKPPKELPRENSHDSPNKIKTIPCDVKKTLQDVFEPHNKALFAMMARDKQWRPSLEPDFPPFPDLVSCHLDNGAVVPAADATDPPASAAASDEADVCHDTPQWRNGWGREGLTCDDYKAKGYCNGVGLAKGMEWAGGERYNSPELHCCHCRDTREATAVPSRVCKDAEGWHNGKGLTCDDYKAKGYCNGVGFAKGMEWAGGERYNSPEAHCCHCHL